MYTLNVLRACVITIAFSGASMAAESPNLGQPITEKEAAAWDISIGPSGENLPPGRGTVKQGAEVYYNKCQACHGEKGEGKPADKLVGGQGTLMGDQVPVKTVGSYWPYATTLFDYVRRAMPLTDPQSLTNNEVYALSAYVLYLNNIIPEKAVMDAKSLPRVKMPNKGNFTIVYEGKAP
jgi:S-disulfanyl-L-cysteine oxidoreductase SoxD